MSNVPHHKYSAKEHRNFGIFHLVLWSAASLFLIIATVTEGFFIEFIFIFPACLFSVFLGIHEIKTANKMIQEGNTSSH